MSNMGEWDSETIKELTEKIAALKVNYKVVADQARMGHERHMKLINEHTALKRKIDMAIERIRSEDDPEVGKPWLVEHVLALHTAEEQE